MKLYILLYLALNIELGSLKTFSRIIFDLNSDYMF